MTWEAIAAIIRAESGDAADRVLKRVEFELKGMRICVPTRPRVSDGEIQKALRANGYSVKQAAEALNVSKATLYRRLRPKQQQTQSAPPGTYRGRLVR